MSVRDTFYAAKVTRASIRSNDGGYIWTPERPTEDFQLLSQNQIHWRLSYGQRHEGRFPVLAGDHGADFAIDRHAHEATANHDFDAEQDLCMQCGDIDLRGLFGLSRKRYKLGSLESMISCQKCPLCRLITKGIELQTLRSVSEIVRQHNNSHLVLTSLPVVLPVGNRKERVYELVVYIIEQHNMLVSLVRFRLLHEDCSVVGKLPHFYGRRINRNHSLELARKWLQHCEEQHSCLATGLGSSSISSVPSPQLFLVDVRKNCLVQSTTKARYVALSYVWSKDESLKLSTSNIVSLQQPGALRVARPPIASVIAEAMHIVEKIGETYLWVDALCIVQDDNGMTSGLVDSMDQVYGYAVLTIIAGTVNGATLGAHRDGCSSQAIEKVQGLRLVSALPDIKTVTSRSRWSTRAWTFQEAILSRRCLIFTEQQLYFRCLIDYCCEDVIEGSSRKVDLHPARPQVPLSSLESLLSPSLQNRMEGKAFEKYVLLIREYSSRQMTFPNDVIRAFTGIANALGKYYSGHGFLLGLPQEIFDLAMLWYHTAPAKRRGAIAFKEVESVECDWPSWSWTRWITSIDYEDQHVRTSGTSSLRTCIIWYRLKDSCSLVRVPSIFSVIEEDDPDFSLGMLYSKLPLLRARPTRLVFWAYVVNIHTTITEQPIAEFLSEYLQTLPCFTLLDPSGDSCGFVSVSDREWATLNMKSEGESRECSLIILSISPQEPESEKYFHKNFFHGKYNIKATGGEPWCFFNIMLVEWIEDVAYRRGLGRLHQDSVFGVDGIELGKCQRKIVVLD